jgi:enolase
MFLKKVSAKKIKDSRGDSTIEISVNKQPASSPSGKSTGKYETPSYRKSLKQSIKDINNSDFSGIEINSFQDLSKLESFIKKKFKLKDVKQFGANVLFALECATLKALAKEKNKQLFQIINPNARKIPVFVGNATGGGMHSHNKNKPAFQEFLIITKNLKLMQKIYRQIKTKIKAASKNDEGAWQTSLNSEQILEILSKIKTVKIGLDIAASSFYKNKNYCYKQKQLNKTAQIHYINSLIKKYNLFYIEDPLHEEDFKGFSKIKHSYSHLVVGDDLTATQISRVKKAIRQKSINALIIKPNQNGSLLELKQIFDICKKNKIKTILSHRSGETMDSALADLAVGFRADYIKAGISTKWREVKLKRLVEIKESL